MRVVRYRRDDGKLYSYPVQPGWFEAQHREIHELEAQITKLEQRKLTESVHGNGAAAAATHLEIAALQVELEQLRSQLGTEPEGGGP